MPLAHFWRWRLLFSSAAARPPTIRRRTSAPAITAPVAAATAVDGTWTSNDGVFVATFQAGAFTSRFTQTNEVLAQGTYSVSGDIVNLQWISVATQQQRSAICAHSAPDMLTCNQSGGGSFDLKRAA